MLPQVKVYNPEMEVIERMRFCDKLPKLRKENNLSQEQLAERLNVSRQAVSKWESGSSYPDMEKLLQICKVLNCTLEDIMDDGAVNPNEESKNKKQLGLSDYLNSFLGVVTRTYNMFCSMSWKSRIMCVLETCFIALIIFLAGALIYEGLRSFLYNILSILPNPIDYYLSFILSRIVKALVFVLGIITFMHLFKIRYLDYYITVEDSTVKEKSIEEDIDMKVVNKDNIGKPKNAKIIIRDPKHSSENFFQALGKVFVFLFKMLIVICAVPAAIGLILGVGVCCAMIYNALYSSAFIWPALSAIGFAMLCYVLVHLAYNYIFKQKQPYKIMLIVLLSGFILIGCGLGIFVSEILTFDEISPMENATLITEEIIISDITDTTQLTAFTDNIEYVIDDNTDGVKITATYPDYIDLYVQEYADRTHISPYYKHEVFGIYKLFLSDVRNSQIRTNYEVYNMLKLNVRLSQETYDIMYSYDEEY